MIEHGLNTVLSRRSVGETIDTLVAIVEAAGLTVFIRIDHGAGAAAAGLPAPADGTPASATRMRERR